MKHIALFLILASCAYGQSITQVTWKLAGDNYEATCHAGYVGIVYDVPHRKWIEATGIMPVELMKMNWDGAQTAGYLCRKDVAHEQDKPKPCPQGQVMYDGACTTIESLPFIDNRADTIMSCQSLPDGTPRDCKIAAGHTLDEVVQVWTEQHQRDEKLCAGWVSYVAYQDFRRDFNAHKPKPKHPKPAPKAK